MTIPNSMKSKKYHGLTTDEQRNIDTKKQRQNLWIRYQNAIENNNHIEADNIAATLAEPRD